MADSVLITSNVIDGNSINANVASGVTINTNVVESTTITGNVIAGGVGPAGPNQVTGLITAGTNISFTGAGTLVSPYNISAAGGGGSGTVTSVSVTTANGVSGSVATATTTPAISLTLGAITPTSVNGTTSTEIGYLSGVTSAIQTQLGAKVNTGTSAANNQLAVFSDATGNNLKSGGISTGSIVTLTGANVLTNKDLTSGTNTFPTFNQNTTGSAATVGTINGLITQGTNVTITGTGTSGSPYNISATGGGGGGSGITRSVVSVTTSTTLGATTLTDYVAFVGASGAPTLPTAVGNTNQYSIKNVHTTNKIIATTSSQTIDGSTTITIIPNQAVTVVSDGANWQIV